MTENEEICKALLGIRSRVIVAFSSLGLSSDEDINETGKLINIQFREEAIRRIKQIKAMSMKGINSYDWQNVLSDEEWISIIQNAFSYRGLLQDFCEYEFEVLTIAFTEEKIVDLIWGKSVKSVLEEHKSKN